ncbi:DUF4430 domain-containing protein [Paenibacillus sp. HJL G12]|uniref:DUF4430 domain-containing protein n=1 Tax=Paenibacillus dendrobii TaxID=2691084 RepID=A0A7X3LJG2_9BACL|nr:DUF4430 domain-containing protein [Paenibacillus dendrobii]MWV47182.1 DUF4430 domain-containing protein [Paenibacillus dendrobii]
MKNKKWLYAVLIVAVLAVAFFWGGHDQKKQAATKTDVSQTDQGTPATTGSPSGITSPDEEKSQPELGAQSSDKSADNPTGTEDTAKPAASAADPAAKDSGTGAKQQDAKESQDASVTMDGTSASPKSDSAKTDNAGKAPAADEKAPAKASSKTPEKSTVTKPDDQSATKPGKTESAAADTKPKKDKYQTDPVPAGKPKPVEWQDANVDKKQQLTATLSVSAASILDHMDQFNKDKLEVLPKDGVIYKAQKVTFFEGESVFDVLLREMKKNKIHLEFSMTPIYNSNYIEGIHNLYEFDCGELSGWMYKVNGWFPNYGSSRYALKDGDVIEWVYTCDLGRDVGGYVAAGGKQ